MWKNIHTLDESKQAHVGKAVLPGVNYSSEHWIDVWWSDARLSGVTVLRDEELHKCKSSAYDLMSMNYAVLPWTLRDTQHSAG